jgi:putative PIN family toxin of toxin-antitoxin system
VRVVLDTNVLVAAAYNRRSASRRIVEACLEGTLTAVASEAVRREYEFILARAVRVPDYEERLAALVDGLQIVLPEETPRVVAEDPDDDKILAAAVSGGAEWVVTSDRHLLALDPYRGVRIAPAAQFVKVMLS